MCIINCYRWLRRRFIPTIYYISSSENQNYFSATNHTRTRCKTLKAAEPKLIVHKLVVVNVEVLDVVKIVH